MTTVGEIRGLTSAIDALDIEEPHLHKVYIREIL